MAIGLDTGDRLQVNQAYLFMFIHRQLEQAARKDGFPPGGFGDLLIARGGGQLGQVVEDHAGAMMPAPGADHPGHLDQQHLLGDIDDHGHGRRRGHRAAGFFQQKAHLVAALFRV